jgi:hypothetical protein
MLRQVMLGASCALSLTLGAPASAQANGDTAVCHIIYGGENFTVSARPTGDPYGVRGEKIGRYFEVKVSYVTAPADLSSLSVYVYATSSGDSVLIHQAKYPANVTNGTGPWGFTGLNYVYEPSKSSEIQFWCEKRS